MDYKNSGVDIEAGYKSVELMKKYVQGTMRPEVLTGLGGFSGAFSMEKFKNMEKPTLVSGTDGVGTKLKLAFLMDKHDTIGIDCVAMCVNDIDRKSMWKKLSGKDCGNCKRCRRGMQTVRCSPDRWRDSRASGTDA